MNEEKRRDDANRGITLISLVITIILLLILATVAINLAIDSNGLFSKAGEAVNKWNNKVAQEEEALREIEALMNELNGGTSSGGTTEEEETDEPIEPEVVAVESVSLDSASVTVVIGKTVTLVATVNPSNATNQNVTFSTSDASIATADNAGVVTGVKGGTVIITVTTEDGSKTATCEVTIDPNPYDKTIVPTVVTEGERTAPIPAGYVASQVTGEKTISDGLVIYETDTTVDDTNHSTALTSYNQYVWIPVDDINDMIMCSVCKGTSENLVYDDTTKTLTCTNTHADGTTPTLVGKLYDTYVEGGNTLSSGVYTRHQDFTYTGQEYSDTYTGTREPAVVDDDGAEDDYHGLADANAFLAQLQGDFSNMAKSVAKYKGFYVGRYEAGANGATKKGQAVMNAETDNQMWYGLHNTLRSDPEVVSSTYSQMIWGSQYDQMMKFLEEDVSNEPYIGHKDRGLSSSPAVSGNAPLDEMSNIFDLEGNYLEWTAEANNAPSRVLRGRLLQLRGLWPFRSSQLPQ